MAYESMMYTNEPYGARGGRPYPDREQEAHFITPPTYFQHERNGFPNRQPEAPYYYDASKEPPNQESQYRHQGHRSPFPHHVDRAFPRNREEMHYDSHPRAALNFPPRHNYPEERFPGHMRLPPPRPMSYSQERGEIHSHPCGRESSPTEMSHHKSQIISQRAIQHGDRSRNAKVDRTIRLTHSTDSTIILTHSTDSTSSVAASVDASQSLLKQGGSECNKNSSQQPPPKSNENNTDMLNDALLLASVAKMARSEVDHKPNTSCNLIERTVSVDAKDSPDADRARTPSPRNVDDCKAVTPSLSSKMHPAPHSDFAKENDVQDVIKNKLSQVSVESIGNLDRPLIEMRTSESHDQGEERAPPRHPLSFSREERTTRHYHGRSPSFTGSVPDHAHPRRLGDAEVASGNSPDSDHHHRFQHFPGDSYHHSYGGHPAPRPRPHEMKHDRYPVYRPQPRYEESPHFEDEMRFSRYPLQPMHPHRPIYSSREDRPYFHLPGHYNRPPGYHGVPTQHFTDRRGMGGPSRRPDDLHPVRRDGFRAPSHDYRGYPLHSQGQPHHPNSGKIFLKRKCAWKNYPELEHFLIENREEYLRHSAMNYTQEQKQYNNELTERLLEVAAKHNYEFDRKDFNFVAIRDRIRCYYKSYVQNCKKRGISIDHKTNKKQKIEEEYDAKDTITTVSHEVASDTNAADCGESGECPSDEKHQSNIDASDVETLDGE